MLWLIHSRDDISAATAWNKQLLQSTWHGSIHNMAANEVAHGPVSRRVVENVQRLRRARGWSLERLSQELGRVGRPILSTGLNRLEQGRRRIDADDLVALAVVLDVSPLTLMLPFEATGVVQVTKDLEAEALTAWSWMRGVSPLVSPADEDDSQFAVIDFQRRSLPPGVRPRISPGLATRLADHAHGTEA
jgi:transcriptional regulator with XRE-family HTH domain